MNIFSKAMGLKNINVQDIDVSMEAYLQCWWMKRDKQTNSLDYFSNAENSFVLWGGFPNHYLLIIFLDIPRCISTIQYLLGKDIMNMKNKAYGINSAVGHNSVQYTESVTHAMQQRNHSYKHGLWGSDILDLCSTVLSTDSLNSLGSGCWVNGK